MKVKHYTILLFFVGVFVQCNKEPIPPPEECTPLVNITDYLGNSLFINQFPFYYMASFNPNNSDEIIFFEAKSSADSLNLTKWNLATQKKEVIFRSDGFKARSRWSRKDWILLNLGDFNIYKIKSNGDSLTQLTTTGRCVGAEWNKDGTKFIYESIESGNISIICDEHGTPLDTLDGASIVLNWNHDSLILSAHHNGVVIYNPETDSVIYDLISYEGGVSISGWTSVDWLDQENVIWSNVEGIYSANIHTKVVSKIKDSCDAKRYMNPTYSKQLSKILFNRFDRHEKGELAGKALSHLYLMNPDGTAEEKIEIME